MKFKLFILCILPLVITSFKVNGQAKKYILFEHFTNASCSPCAAQNPIFDTAILKKNYGRIHHISYHTDWPGTDPMNAYNATEVQSRVTYYNVTGVPTVKMLGTRYSGGPAGVVQKMIDKASSDYSPIRIRVKQISNGTGRDVRIVVYTLQAVPAGSYRILATVLEKEKHYTSAPGSNGEKHFPDVFRKMMPNTGGDIYTPAAVGDSVTFNYSYSLDAANWDTSKIYVAAFIQNTSTKEVLNSGSSIDPQWEFVPVGKGFLSATKSSTKIFNYVIDNLSDSSSDFMVRLNSGQPAGWNSYFEINSVQSNDSMQISMLPNTSITFSLTVETDNNPGLSNHLISIKCLNDTFQSQIVQSNVIQGITDLIVNNDQPWGDGNISRTAEFQKFYVKGLEAAGNTSFTSIPQETFIKGFKDSVLNNYKYIYYNVGWSFPGFTDENVSAFKKILDNGGRLMVSGQDVGWDTWDLTNGGNGTTNTQNFYTNYLNASWVDDGSTANSSLIPNTSDILFGETDTSAIVNLYGSGNNGPYFYPDQINSRGNGIPVFYYNSTSKVAAVRATNGTYRTVYLGFSLEQLQDSLVKVQIMKLTHDWFHNIITGIEFDQAMNELIAGQNYPNPADAFTIIPLNKAEGNCILYVYDLNGRKILESPVPEGSSSILLNTSAIDTGIYLFYIRNGKNISRPERLLIIH